MSTGYGWKGIRQVCATLLGARHLSASAVAVSIVRGAITNLLLSNFLYLSTVFRLTAILNCLYSHRIAVRIIIRDKK